MTGSRSSPRKSTGRSTRPSSSLSSRHITNRKRRSITCTPSASVTANCTARRGATAGAVASPPKHRTTMALTTYIDAITTALREEMRRDDRVYIIGEDVGAMGGVFKATKGLYEEFGAERVIDSPLAEGIIISSS